MLPSLTGDTPRLKIEAAGEAISRRAGRIQVERLMSEMRAAYYDEHGGPDKLQVGDRPKPVPAEDEVLIKNHAAAVGSWDVDVMAGRFGDPPLPMIPGCEVAGVVEAVANGSDFEPGDQVYGCLGFASGGFAEYAIASPTRLAHKPDEVSFEEAAALVVGAGTAHEGLTDKAEVHADETVLITAASGGVGTAALQIAAGSGARVLAVASARNHDYVRDLGASDAFDYNDPSWVTRLRDSVPEGLDVLFDCAGGETRDQAIDMIKEGGRGVFIVGTPADLRPDIQPHLFSADITRSRLEAISKLVRTGGLKTHIEAKPSLEQAREAMAHVARRHTRGRVVLKIL